ncbi:MAG: MoaD/ThiS family protein [Bacteroidota bacterium]
MKINLLAFGIAKDILNEKQAVIEVNDMTTVGQLKEKLLIQYPDFQNLKSISLAVGMEYRSDDFVLNPSDEVVIIPPVSGG